MNIFDTAVLSPAIIEENGKEITAEVKSSSKGSIIYSIPDYDISDKITDLKNGIIEIKRTITNTSGTAKVFKSIFEATTLFTPEQYVFPCLIYNGNPIGKDATPRGLEYEGKPWIFAYDRMGIPSCTISENTDKGFALFTSDKDRASLESACSLIKHGDGTFRHRIYHPVTEAPVSYTGKNRMTGRYDRYFTLQPKESVTLTVFAFACAPMWKNYTTANLIDVLYSVFKAENPPVMTSEETHRLGISYIKSLLYKYQGHDMIITHYAPNAYSRMSCGLLSDEALAELLRNPENTKLVTHERFECGWADQGMLNARHLAREGLKKGDHELLQTAIGIFDSWVATQKENGLLYSLFEKNYTDLKPEHKTVDTCNMGWAMREAVEMYNLLKKNGVERPEYLSFAKKLADFFVNSFDSENAFGKIWSIDGECIDKGGTVGGFALLGMLYVYSATKDERYLECAIKAHDIYYKRDLDSFVCLAGALDCNSVDKESSYPFIKSSLMLYEITGKEIYLDRAKKAAYYFISWMFFYNVITEEDSDFNIYGYNTVGGTAISAEHNAIDAWASIVVPDLWKLYEITKNKVWLKTAKIFWSNAIMGIATEERQEFHGQIRPVGSQNEGFFQCRWTKYRPTCEERGHFNDCLSAWCGAFRLYAVEQLENTEFWK